MLKPVALGVVVVGLVLMSSTFAEGWGRFRGRHCYSTVCNPPEDRMKTVEILVTSIATSALNVHQQKDLDAKTKEKLLAEFQVQIGPVARNARRLAELLADGI